MICANNRIHYDPVVEFVCLHIALPLYDLFEVIELLICLSGTFVSSVCLRLSQFSQLFFMQYKGLLCIQLTHLSYGDCENTCTYYHLIIIIKSEVWPIYHCLGLSLETMLFTVFFFYSYALLTYEFIATMVRREKTLANYFFGEWSIYLMGSLQVITDNQIRGLIQQPTWKCPILSQFYEYCVIHAWQFRYGQSVDNKSRGM